MTASNIVTLRTGFFSFFKNSNNNKIKKQQVGVRVCKWNTLECQVVFPEEYKNLITSDSKMNI